MIGSIRWNAMFGGLGFCIVFIASISSNILVTTLLRSLYCGIILFILAYIFRWILGTIHHWNDLSGESVIGTNLDLVTPDESKEMYELIRGPMGDTDPEESSFSPLNPPKLAIKNNLDPEELSKALRYMSED